MGGGSKVQGRDLRIKLALERLYPDKKVKNISQKDKRLYTEIRNTIIERNIDLVNYIKSLGFDYINGWKESLTEQEAINLLNGFFPDKKISNISIISKNSVLYSFVREKSKKMKIDTTDYLERLGFVYEGNINTNYDITALKRLNQEYSINMSELARILGTTKQNLDQKIKSKRQPTMPWQKEDFNSKEIDIITKIIKNQDHYYEDIDKEIIVRIYHPLKNDGKIAILYKENETIKCKFDLPDDIMTELEKAQFDIFNEKDIEIIKTINSDQQLCQIEDNDDSIKILNVTDQKLKNKIIARANNLKMKYGEYLNYIGFGSLNKRKYSDKDIIDKLSKYVIHDNIVKVPVNSNDYIRFFRIAENRGYKGLEKFIEAFGFKYERIRTTEDISEIHTSIIKNSYIVYSNKIYINSLDPFYNRMCSYSYKNNISLDDYIKQLGFERIRNPKELPADYVQLDWKSNELNRLKHAYKDDNIISILVELANENNEIYLDTSSQTYWHLWKISNIRGMTINRLIESLGFRRLYAWDNHKIERPRIPQEPLQDEKEFVQSKIVELKEIQGGLEVSKTKIDRINRSQKLVKTIKNLYHCKCQLCSDGEYGLSVPPIEVDEIGNLYIEVHHIIPINESKKWEDESDKEIDTYKNVIVVCSYHHKYLHYYHGGFNSIIEMEDGLYFVSKLGDTIKITTNYHLSATK